jgi:hypothetical protein
LDTNADVQAQGFRRTVHDFYTFSHLLYLHRMSSIGQILNIKKRAGENPI